MKCGHPLGIVEDEPELQVIDASLGCIKCGADLPEGAQFCLKCGKPVSSRSKTTIKNAPPVVGTAGAPPAKQRRKLWLISWLLVLIACIAVVWGTTSESTAALGIQELVGWKHDQTVLDTPFSVSPHNFRYYKFSLPEGSVNVAILGQFAVTGEPPKRRAAAGKSKTPEEKSENTIEVYVLSEAAFTVWQNGYATSSLYESGRVSGGTLNQELPAGAGIYYLVFSNKSDAKAGKNIHASVLLRYKSWVPESLRRTNERFWNWVGI
jgi:ribosomal protein L40E